MKMIFSHIKMCCILYLKNVNIYTIFCCIIITFCVLTYISLKHYESINRHILWYNIFETVYITIILVITILGREKIEANTDAFSQSTLSFVLLLNGNDNIIYDILFNVLLFIPLGIILSVKYRTLQSVILILIFTLVIEISQAITRRGLFEYTDIATNAIGGILGIGLSNFFKLTIKK